MKTLTDLFERDKATVVIRCNARKQNRKGYRRAAVLIAASSSSWTNSYKEEVDASVGFRTEFNLYRSKDEYLLQVKGVSDHPTAFPERFKVIVFSSPQECMEIVDNAEDSRLYMSEPLLALLDKVQSSPYLTFDEKRLWEEILLEDETT